MLLNPLYKLDPADRHGRVIEPFEERDRHAISNRIRDAQLPRMKTLEEFDFAQSPQISAALI